MAAYNEIRNSRATEKWGVPYKQLDPKRQDLIEEVIPLRISEAEPN